MKRLIYKGHASIARTILGSRSNRRTFGLFSKAEEETPISIEVDIEKNGHPISITEFIYKILDEGSKVDKTSFSGFHDKFKKMNQTKDLNSFKIEEIKRLKDINMKNEQNIKTVELDIEQEQEEKTSIMERLDKQYENERNYGITKFAKETLDICDNFERSLKNLKKDDKIYNLIKKNEEVVLDIFEKFGVCQIKNVIDRKVDLEFCEIAAVIPFPGKEDEIVLDVIQNGYMIRQRVLRPVKVVSVRN